MNQRAKFAIQDGDLQISDESGRELWRGRPDERAVEKMKITPNGEYAVVLVASPQNLWKKAPSNVFLVRRDGSTAWIGELPGHNNWGAEGEAYAGIEDVNNQVVTLFECAGWSCCLDISTGRLLTKQFVK